MEGPREMVFDSEYYNSEKDMWDDISTFLQMLTKNEYEAQVYHDDLSIYVVRYDSLERLGLGNKTIHWCDPFMCETCECCNPTEKPTEE